MKRKSEVLQESILETLKKPKNDKIQNKQQQPLLIKSAETNLNQKKNDEKKSGKIKSKSTDDSSLDITQSLTDTGISKSKKFRFEKSGGKKLGKFKKAASSETLKKPNWTEFKQKKKEVQKKRKIAGNSHYDIIVESKKIWEQVRRADCPDEKKNQLLKNLHKMLKDKMGQVIFSHDMSRIIQWLLKLSPTSMRTEIVTELLPLVVSMIKSKYSNVIVKHMLKYGDEKIKNDIIAALQPHVVTLLSHSTASPILMYTYDQVASPEQKLSMRQELYGGLYKSNTEQKINSLEDIFKQSPEMKTAILSVTKKIVTKSLQKAHVTGSALLHTVLLDYINHSNDTDLTEVLEMLAPLPILQFIYTKPGASVAMHIIWNATNKLKKKIMKELKGHVKEVAISEFGHLALVTLFDNIDDTVLLKKAILSELLNEIAPIAENEYGRKLVTHLISWCDSGFFHPSCVVEIKKGDDFSTRKKEREIRNKELLEAMSEPLLNCITKDPNFWFSNSSIAMVAAVIVKTAIGPGLKEALDCIGNIIIDIDRKVLDDQKKSIDKSNKKKKQSKTETSNKVQTKSESENQNLIPFIEHAGFHIVLKKLIQHDKENVKKGLPTLSESIVSKLTKDVLDKWTDCNRACFILVGILESEVESCISELKSKLKSYKKKLETQKFTGAKVLLGKL